MDDLSTEIPRFIFNSVEMMKSVKREENIMCRETWILKNPK